MKNPTSMQTSEHRQVLDALQAAREAMQSLSSLEADSASGQAVVLQRAYKRASYAAHRIGSLWVAARFQAGEFQPEPKPVAVRSLVEAAIERVSAQVEEQGASLQTKIERTPPIHGDRELLLSLLTNLLASALDASQSDTQLSISAFEHQSRITIKLEGGGASGSLFPPAILAAGETVGSGSDLPDLGILTAKAIVEAHGGEMWVEQQGEPAGALLLAFPPSPEETLQEAPSGKKVLIVDDDSDGAFMLEQVLANGGFSTEIAFDGLSGLARAQADDVGLVLLDVMLPGMDGFEVCHRLRSNPDTAQLPILMVSAKGRPEDVETGLRMGANAYLTKPLRLMEVVDQVKELMQKAN